MPIITAAQFARVAPHAAAHIVAAIVDHADGVLPRYGLATAERLPDFLAHVLVESAYLTRLSEDLDYIRERLERRTSQRPTRLGPRRTPGMVHSSLSTRAYPCGHRRA